MRIKSKIGLILLLVTLSGFCTSCDESTYDIAIGSLSFTCIETSLNSRLYVCDQTNVLYLSNGNCSSYTTLIKEDGTAYTLDDYKKDCSQAKLYREDGQS